MVQRRYLFVLLLDKLEFRIDRLDEVGYDRVLLKSKKVFGAPNTRGIIQNVVTQYRGHTREKVFQNFFLEMIGVKTCGESEFDIFKAKKRFPDPGKAYLLKRKCNFCDFSLQYTRLPWIREVFFKKIFFT
jgi:hypothetical protein